jgi:sec-independent protein translocase protein TatB
MFDFDAGKLVIFGIVALAVIPPKDLPRVLRTVGNYVGKMRRMASEFQGQFMDAMKEAEKAADLESVKKEFNSLTDSAKVDASYDPAQHMRSVMTSAIDAPAAPIATSTVDVAGASEPVVPLADRFSTEVFAKAPETQAVPPLTSEPAAPSHAP